MSGEFPEFAYQMRSPCTRSVLGKMLRNRGYKLEFTRFKKDKGLVRVYMSDPWADPALVQIGTYLHDEQPDWGGMYDAAMAHHLETKADGSRYGIS